MTTSDQPGRAPGGGAPAAAGAPGPPVDGPPQLRSLPRWVRWTVLPLLVLVPLGYMIISAEQSRASGNDPLQNRAGRQLTQVYPPRVTQRIYQVPVPVGSRFTRYLEQNSWDTSVLYTEFLTTPGGLDTFLAQVGTSRTALAPGKVTMNAAQCKATGWHFGPGRAWAGVVLKAPGDRPDHDITVDMTHPDSPRVYVVSTVNFQHGFGGG